MPIDTSIYSMIQPARPPVDPLAQYGNALQIGALLDQGDVNRLQRRKLESDLAEEDAYKKLFAGGRMPTTAETMAASPSRGMQFQKSLLEQQKAQAELQKTNLESLSKSLQIQRDALASVNTPQEAAQWVMAGYNDPVLSPFLQRAGSPQEVISRIPQDPQGFQDWKMRNALSAEKLIAQTAPKVEMVDTGATKAPIQTNPLAAGGVGPVAGAAPIQKTATPGERMADARAREQMDRDKFGQPFEATVDGKPRLLMQNKNNGELVDANTRQPVAGAAPKVSEAARKQQTGVQNTTAAIDNYLAALKNWDWKDAANPNARAKMGTAYNNMLLQAKEAYDLGVLNGPDYQILQEVITNPASLKGGITSNEALADQAKQLKEIMGRVGKQITATQTGAPSPAAVPVKTPNIAGFKVIRVQKP